MSRSKRESAEELERILTPLIDFTRNRVSFSKFARESDQLLARVQETGHPVILDKNGQICAIVSDPKVFAEIEIGRRSLASILKGNEVLAPGGRPPRPTASRPSAECSKIIAIEGCSMKIESLKMRIYEDEKVRDRFEGQISRNRQELMKARKEKRKLLSRV